jgi:arylsulfatase A-like enzyme
MRALTLLAVLLAVGGAACARQGERGTRIVLVTLDTLRYDCLPAEPGSPERMPRTRRFAERGVRFAAHRTASSTTQPTHATLLTGLQPWEHGVVRNGLVLADPLPTLAERLRERGWETAAVVASTPLHRRFGFAQGFDHFVDEFSEGARPSFGGAALDPEAEFYAPAESVTRHALALLDGMRAPQQLLWVHYFDAHGPYGDTAEGEPVRLQNLHRALRKRDPGAAALLQRARALYDVDVAYLDRWLETLLARVEADSDRYETHVVVVADHGESFGEDGSVGHGKRLTPSQTHVPSFIVSPRVAPRIETTTVGTLDLAATLLSLAGDEGGVPGGRDLTRPEIPPRPVFGMRRTFSKPHKEIRTDGEVHVADGAFFYVVESGRTWLGNASGVLDETEQPLRGEEAERVRALFAGFEAQAARTAAPEITDPETLRALKALGYTR